MVFAFVMVICAEAYFVASVTEVAVTVTVLPEVTVVGAEKSVGAPLAVLAALKEPHAALPQVAVQVTPAFAESSATMAVNAAPLESCNEVGAGPRVTAIVVVIVISAEADFEVSVTDVAVTVTVLAVGLAAGAV